MTAATSASFPVSQVIVCSYWSNLPNLGKQSFFVTAPVPQMDSNTGSLYLKPSILPLSHWHRDTGRSNWIQYILWVPLLIQQLWIAYNYGYKWEVMFPVTNVLEATNVLNFLSQSMSTSVELYGLQLNFYNFNMVGASMNGAGVSLHRVPMLWKHPGGFWVWIFCAWKPLGASTTCWFPRILHRSWYVVDASTDGTSRDWYSVPCKNNNFSRLAS